MTIVRQVEKCLNEVEASPGEDLLVLKVGLHLEDLRGGGVTLLLSKTENVGVPQNLLEQRQLTLGVAPVSVEKVDGKRSLISLSGEAELESLHQQHKSSSVLHAEAGMVKFINDFFPVEGGLEFMNRFDENFNVPSLVRLVFFLPEAVCVWCEGEGGVVVEAGVGPHHDPDHLGHGGGIHLPAPELEQGGATLLHAGCEVVTHLQHKVGQRPVQEAAPLDRHHGAGGHEAVTEAGMQSGQKKSRAPVPGKFSPQMNKKSVNEVLVNTLVATNHKLEKSLKIFLWLALLQRLGVCSQQLSHYELQSLCHQVLGLTPDLCEGGELGQVIAVMQLLQRRELEILDQEAGRDNTAAAQRSVHTPINEATINDDKSSINFK